MCESREVGTQSVGSTRPTEADLKLLGKSSQNGDAGLVTKVSVTLNDGASMPDSDEAAPSAS
jgi:hypothetical protein